MFFFYEMCKKENGILMILDALLNLRVHLPVCRWLNLAQVDDLFSVFECGSCVLLHRIKQKERSSFEELCSY